MSIFPTKILLASTSLLPSSRGRYQTDEQESTDDTVRGHLTGASFYEVTRLQPWAAVGRHQGVQPTCHLQGTFGSPRRRVRPVRGVAHSYSPGYSQPRR